MKFDPNAAEFVADPYPAYAHWRADRPVFPLNPGAWLVTRYRDADRLLRDPRLGKDFLTGMKWRYGRDMGEEPAFRIVNRFMLLMNPPAHTRLRALVGKAFGVRQAPDLRRLAQRAADDLADACLPLGQADLQTVFAYPLPVRTICALLDVELSHSLEFQQETQSLVKIFELAPMNAEEIEAANAAALRFETFFRDICRARRGKPGNDLVSLLLRAEEGGDRLSEDEIVANIVLLFVAGHETTSNMIGNALITLFRHPEQLAWLRRNLASIPQAVEECLRYETSVHIAARVARENLEIGDARIAAGDTLYIALGSANRDPEIFDEPERFWIERPAAAANSLSFGGGAHYCLGARLAKIELETALETLLRRFPNLRPEAPDRPEWKPTLTVRGLKTLPARWDPA